VLRITIVASDAARQTTVSQPFSILVAPHSAGLEQHLCVDELRQAARLSQSLADEMPEVLRAERQSRMAPPTRNTHLSRCSDLSEQLGAHLLRALSLNRYPQLSPILMTLLDQTAIVQANIATARLSREPLDEDSRSRTIARAEQCVRKLRDLTRDLSAAEQARLIKRDLLNFRTLVDSLAHGRNSELLRDYLNVAGRTVDERIKGLAIAPDDDRLIELLDERIAVGEGQFEPMQSDELVWAVQHVSSLEMSQRLLTASRAQALRADADFAYSRDLNLAATARRTWPDGELASFRDALAVLLRQMRVPADAARAALRRHAQSNPELDAFESAAGIQKTPAAMPADGSSPEIFAKIYGAEKGSQHLPLFSPAEMLASAEDLVIHNEPVAAARCYAELAAKASAAPVPDSHEVESLRHRAKAAAQIAVERTAHHLAANKIRAVPAIASLLQDAKPTMIVPLPPPIAREMPAPSTDTITSSPGGYDEPLRLYFQMLKGSQ
jgi:hypothetical protein